MTTLDAIIAAGRKPGVQVYSPARALPPALTGRQTSQQYNQARQQAAATPAVSPWSNLADKYINSPENQQQQAQTAQATAQKEAMAKLPAWKRTIANVVTNPLVKYPLALLGEPAKVINTALEEGVKLLPDSVERRMAQPFGSSDNPVVQGLNSVAPLMGAVWGMDPAKTHDGQSIGSRLAPLSNYGSAEIYGNDFNVPVLTGARNFALDVSHDPLTYFLGGGERVAVDAAEAARTAKIADEANAALAAAKKGFAAPDVIAEADRTAQEAAMAARQGATPVRTAIPHTQKARADLIAELVVHDPSLSEKFSSELATGVRKGFRFMSPEAREAIGVDRIGIKSVLTDTVLPGTEALTKPFAVGGNLVRETLGRALPSGAARGSEEVAKILEGADSASAKSTAALASGVLSGKVAGPYDLAAAHRWTVNQGRMFEGTAKNLGTRALVDTVKTALKKTNAAEREALVYEAETTGTKTPLNDLAGRILNINQQVAGRELDPAHLRNPDTYVPHILEPKFRRVLKRALEKGTDEEKAKAAAFLDANGMRTQDLLETSGFLDHARQLTTDNGAPKVIALGKNGSAGQLVITDDTIRGLNNNASMRNYFSGYTGKFYMDDPIKIFDAYSSSLARDAGRRGAQIALGRTPSAVAHNVEGDLATALEGYQAALPRQSEPYRTMETIRNNPFTPGSETPIVPDAPAVPDSTQFFEPVKGTKATGEVREFFGGKGVPGPKGVNVNEAKQYIGQVQQEVKDATEPISRNLYDMRTNMMVGLRNETSATSDQIKSVEKIIRTFRSRVDGLGSLTPANSKEFEALLNATDKHVMDLRQELASRIRTYGPQSKYEQDLVTSLEGQIGDVERGARSQISSRSRKVGKEIDDKLAKNLAYFEDTRARLLKKIDDGPILLAKEIKDRNDELFRPVKEAEAIRAAKEASIVAPHTPEEVSAARRTIGDSTSLNADYTDASEKYRRALIERTQHLDSAPKNKAGELTKAAQTKLDEIDSRIKSLRHDLSLGIPRGVTNVNVESKAYEDARLELNRLRHQLTTGEGIVEPAAAVAKVEPAAVEAAAATGQWTDADIRDAKDWLLNDLLDKVPERDLDQLETMIEGADAQQLSELLDMHHSGEAKGFMEELPMRRLDLDPKNPADVAEFLRSQPIETTGSEGAAGLPAATAAAKPAALNSKDAKAWLVNDLLGDPAVAGQTREEVTRRLGRMKPKNLEQLLEQRHPGGVEGFIERQAAAAPAEAAPAVEAAAAPAVEGSRAAIEAKIARIEQRFNQRGDLYEQQKARDVLSAHKKYTEDVKTATQRETANVETARRLAAAQPERLVTSPAGEVLQGTQGIFEGKGYRQVGPMATPPFPETALGQEPRTEAGTLHYLNTKYGRVIEDRLKQIEETLGTETTEGSRQTQARTLSAEAKKSTRAAIRADVAAQVQPTLDNLNAQRNAAAQQLALTQGLHQSDVARLRSRLDTIAQVVPHLTDRNQLMEYRDEVKRVLAELRSPEMNAKNYSTSNELIGVVDGIQAVAAENPLLDNTALNATEAQLNFYRKELQRLEGHDMTVSDMQGMRRAAQTDKTFGKTMVAGMASGWSLMRDGANILPEAGDTIIDSRLKQMFQNTYNVVDQPGLLGRWFNEATNMFKTYATLTPGFHVRNMLSGMFMNASDGVGLTHQIEGLKLWQEFTRSDETWLAKQPERIQKAFAATFGSGAGGRYTETGIGQRTGNSALDKAVDNWATRKSAALGQRIEGGMRLGMALNSVDNGESLHQALARITRIHFDYSQVSQLDQTMKRIIPFWTFMSRNLPLQITQMYMNPAAYQTYNHLVANFSAPNDPNTPGYWAKLGTWNTGLKIGGMPLYFQPDFGFTRLGTDISTLTDPGQMLANVNPVIAAPIDWAQHRDSFYDRSFGPTDFTNQSGPVGTPLSIVARMLPGQTNEAGQVSDNFTNLVRGLVPPIDQIARLFPGALGGGGDQQRQGEAFARYLGAPVRTLSDKQIASEQKNKVYAARDEQTRKRAMAQAIMSS